jgi:peptidoglycan/xylan/chitin deacetylase (PgdA/CDA1 family)
MPPARAVLYAATAGVIVLAARAALIRPPPVLWAMMAMLAYLALILVGVFVLRLRVFADAIVRAPAGSSGVVLTFDDGPDPVWTPRVLEMLERADVKATFFVIGEKAEKHPEIVRETVRRGHTVGLHSYAHDRLFSMRSEARVTQDLRRGVEVLERVTGARPVLFRPPIGHTNPTIARVADKLDLLVVGWTVSGRDGTGRATPAGVAARVRSQVRDGAIVLLHDAAERGTHEPAGPRALESILDALVAERLSVVPLANWLS